MQSLCSAPQLTHRSRNPEQAMVKASASRLQTLLVAITKRPFS